MEFQIGRGALGNMQEKMLPRNLIADPGACSSPALARVAGFAQRV